MDLTYSSRSIVAVQKVLEDFVVQAPKSTKKARAEIRRIFQMANRRIQNVKQAEVFSPAVASLGKSDVEGFSKFNFSGPSDWNELKREYSKAVSFLQQPTSTATGARQFQEQVKAQLDISDAQWQSAQETLMSNYDAVTADLIETLPYKRLVQEMYQESTVDVADQIENKAKAMGDEIESEVERLKKEILNGVNAKHAATFNK